MPRRPGRRGAHPRGGGVRRFPPLPPRCGNPVQHRVRSQAVTVGRHHRAAPRQFSFANRIRRLCFEAILSADVPTRSAATRVRRRTHGASTTARRRSRKPPVVQRMAREPSQCVPAAAWFLTGPRLQLVPQICLDRQTARGKMPSARFEAQRCYAIARTGREHHRHATARGSHVDFKHDALRQPRQSVRPGAGPPIGRVEIKAPPTGRDVELRYDRLLGAGGDTGDDGGSARSISGR